MSDVVRKDDRDDSIPAFCRRRRIGISTYYKMRKDGHGPRELRIPGSSIVRITPQAEADWIAKMEQTPRSEKLAARAAKAGKAAVASSRHPSRRKRVDAAEG
jgi:hypothetical protein